MKNVLLGVLLVSSLAFADTEEQRDEESKEHFVTRHLESCRESGCSPCGLFGWVDITDDEGKHVIRSLLVYRSSICEDEFISERHDRDAKKESDRIIRLYGHGDGGTAPDAGKKP